MNQLFQCARGQSVAPHRPTSLDLILQARAMRHQCFVSALARLAAKLAPFGAELVARPDRIRRPAVPGRLRLSDRVAT